MSDKAIHPVADRRAGSTGPAGPVPGAPGGPSDPVARAVRAELRAVQEELREELLRRSGMRSVRMRSAAAACAFYGGGALAVAFGLGLAVVMPGWLAFLVVAMLLIGLAAALHGAARERPHGPVPAAAGTPPGGAAVPPVPAGTPDVPPVPPVPPRPPEETAGPAAVPPPR